MNPQHLLTSLICLGCLLTAGCAPTTQPTPTTPDWRILLHAIPCPSSLTNCGTDLYLNDLSRWHLVNSNGSGLLALEDTQTFLATMWGHPHLSPDGTHLAYLVRSQTDQQIHLMLSPINSGQTTDLGQAPQTFRTLKFLPEPGCLAVYSSPAQPEPGATETITVTKQCAGSTEHQPLETIQLPNIQPYSHYHLSPQGDALLILTWNPQSIFELYIHEFGTQQPPRLLFTAEDATWSLWGPARWLPDGQSVEFFTQQIQPDGSARVLLYTTDRQATTTQLKLDLKLPFTLISGDWSPDGRELAFFPGLPNYTPQTSGIYILDLTNGQWRQIISGLYNDDPGIRTWHAAIP